MRSALQNLEAGNYTVAYDVTRPCLPNSIDGTCKEPRLCATWPAPSLSCTPQCQTTINDIILQVGCCYESWKHFMGNYSGDDASSNFARIAFLASSCCDTETGASCGNSISGPCGLHSHKVGPVSILSSRAGATGTLLCAVCLTRLPSGPVF